MRDELNEQQLRKTSRLLTLPIDFIRKDFYVTRAIQLLTEAEDDYFSLVFQGGTSLAKGYRVVNRLSEDIDFRIILKPGVATIGKEQKRKRLRDFRYTLIDALSQAGFCISKDQVKVFYEGRFTRIHAEFKAPSAISYLKPHIAIELFLGELILKPKVTSVTSLIKLMLDKECPHTPFSVLCVALDETAAEKWVALTRRIAETQRKQHLMDKHLVRHLYDIYQLQHKALLTGEYLSIIKSIMKKDGEMFKKHSKVYSEDPIRLSKLALDLLLEDKQWENHWDTFLEQMVYEQDKPSFAQAYAKLHLLSQAILNELAGVNK